MIKHSLIFWFDIWFQILLGASPWLLCCSHWKLSLDWLFTYWTKLVHGYTLPFTQVWVGEPGWLYIVTFWIQLTKWSWDLWTLSSCSCFFFLDSVFLGGNETEAVLAPFSNGRQFPGHGFCASLEHLYDNNFLRLDQLAYEQKIWPLGLTICPLAIEVGQSSSIKL